MAAISTSDHPSDAQHSCAVHDNGDLSCWGANDLGQLGNGTTGAGRYWPQRIGRLCDAVAISSGKDHSCAIRRGGSLSCWGWVYGTRPTTVAVPGDVTSVSMGGVETCIATADGRVFCWDYLGNTVSQMTQVAKHQRRGEGLGGRRGRLRAAPARQRVVLGAQRRRAGGGRHHHPPPRAGAAHHDHRCRGHRRRLAGADIDFMWAADPPSDLERTTSGGTYEVLAADPQRNEVVVDLGVGFGTPTVVVYDGNDRFPSRRTGLCR